MRAKLQLFGTSPALRVHRTGMMLQCENALGAPEATTIANKRGSPLPGEPLRLFGIYLVRSPLFASLVTERERARRRLREVLVVVRVIKCVL